MIDFVNLVYQTLFSMSADELFFFLGSGYLLVKFLKFLVKGVISCADKFL